MAGLVALLSLSDSCTIAAPIIWDSTTTIGADTQILTTGADVYAYTQATNTTVNGVTFTAVNSATTWGGGNVTLTLPATAGTNTTTFGTPTGVSTVYGNLTKGAAYGGAGSGTVTLNNLTIGRVYLTQIWVNDSRTAGSGRAETVTSLGGNSVTLDYNSTENTGGAGQFTVGRFFADAATQAFTLSSTTSVQLNALQWREVTNIGNWVGTGGSTWDASTTSNFATNLFSAALATTTFNAAKVSLASVTFADSYWNTGTATTVTQTAVNVGTGGVSTGRVYFDNNAINYTLTSADSTGITGSTAVYKSGTGTVTLAGSNTYSGVTSIWRGYLRIANDSGLGNTAGVSVTSTAGGGALQLADGVTVSGKTITISGFGPNARGSLQAASGAIATWAGPVLIGSADTRVGAEANGTLTISGKISNGAGSNFIVSADATTGKVIVSGTSNDYTGETQIIRGTLALGANNALPTTSVLNVHSATSVPDGAIFDLNGFSQQVAGLRRGNNSGPATVTNSSATLNTLTINNTSNTVYDSAITGNLALVKAGSGTQTLTGTNTFTGTTLINGGKLALGNASALQNSTFDTSGSNGTTIGLDVTGGLSSNTLTLGGLAGSVDLATAITAGYDTVSTLVLNRTTGTSSYSGLIANGAAGMALTKNGAGTQELAGANTFTGGVTVNAGTLRVSNSNGFGTGTKTITMQGPNRVIELSGGLTLGSNLTWQLSSNSGDGGGLSSTSGNNTIQGKININFGNPALNISSSGPSTLTISGNIELVTTGRPLHLGGSSTNQNTISGVISSNSTANVLPIIKQGVGTWVLSGVNTYTGTTTINAGTLRLTNAAGLGSTAAGTTVASGAALELFGGIAVGAETLSLAGTGVAGGGALRSISGNNAYGGTITGTAAASIVADAGTLTLIGDVSSTFDTTFGGAGDIVAAGGLSAAGNMIKTGAGVLTLSVGNSQANTTVNAGQLNVNHLAALGTSAGTLTLAAATTLDNTSGSAVTITNPKSIALGSSLTFAGSNDLDLGTGTVTLAGNTAIDVAARVLTFSGDVVGTGFGITKNGAGTLRLDGLTGSGSFTGNSFVNAGTLLIEGTAVLGGGPSTVLTVADNAFLQIGPSAGLGDVTVVSRPGGVVTASVVNANQTFDQSGTLTTSNANFNGIQTIESGVTISSSANYLGTIPGTATPGRIVFQDTARLRATDDFTIGATQGISLQAGTATLETDADKALLIPAIVAGSGGLRKVGPGNVRLTANNTYAGGTVVEAGIVGISYGDSLGDVSGRLKLDGGTIVGAQTLSAPFISTVTIDSARQFVLANGKTSGIDAQTGLSLRYDGVIAEETLGGTAANLRVGSSTAREGTVILGGANTYTGTTVVDHGKLLVNGSLAAASAVSVASGATLGGSGTIGGPTSILGGGILSPGNSPGTLTVNNTLTLADTSVLAFELNPTDQTIGGGINDLVTGVTDLTLGGTLNLSGSGSFTSVTPGTIWRLFNYTGSLTLGTLTIGTAPTLADGNSFDVDTSTGGQVNLVVVPEPGSLLLVTLGLAAAGWLRVRQASGLARISRFPRASDES